MAKQAPTTIPPVEFKALLYGPPGTGKTTFIGSGVHDARSWPGIIIDTENGTSSIRSKVRRLEISDIKTSVPQEGMYDVVKITEWDQITEVYNEIAEVGHYKLVSLDTISEAAYLCLDDIVQEERRTNPKRANDKEVPELQDYNVSLTRMRKVVRYFNNLPGHVIFGCSAGVDIHPRTKMPRAQPGLQGKLVIEMPHLVTTVGYFDVIEGGDRRLWVSADEKFIAKDRSEDRVLDIELVNPTLPQILNLLEGVK